MPLPGGSPDDTAEFQAQLLMSVDQSVVATDMQGIITYWSPQSARLYGWSRAEALGRPVDQVLAGARSSGDGAPCRNLHAGASWHGELEMLRRDGTTFIASLRSTPILDRSGAQTGVVTVATDVTSRHELEEQLRQAQKMEAVGQLAGGVAHDFNNLLTAIISYGELALQSAPGSIEGDLREILGAARRAADLTGQLLAFSRRQVVRPQPVDIGAVVRAMENMLRRMLTPGIPLDVATPTAPAVVRGDRGQLEQVVLNLVLNARDAVADRDRAHVRLAVSTSVDAVALQVTDTGCGMSDATRARIFEPFFTTKPVGKGTGLGLSVVYGIVQQLAGAVDVKSAPGQGTSFTIEFPRHSGAPPDRTIRDDVPEEGHVPGQTILLVDDNPTLRRVGERVLQRLGYRVIQAADATEALAVAMNGRMDLIVTDVVMPGMSGPGLVRALADRGVYPRVLFTSGYAAEEVFAGSFAGEHAFMAKPWTPEELGAAVRSALEGAQPVARA